MANKTRHAETASNVKRPKLWPEPGELLAWIGEANLSRDENVVVIPVSAEAVLNAYAQWYDSHREASVKIADLAALEH